MRRADRRPNSCGRRMRALDRKLLRDLRHIWMQALAIALVIGCGVAMYVMSFGTLRSLDETRVAYYERYRFADVFASVKRAPERLASRIAAIPGVGRVETRIVAHVTLDVAGMDEPASGLLVSQPERGEALLNLLHVRKGRRIAPGRTGEVVVGEPFAEAHGLGPGDHLFAVINGRKRRLDIVGVALSPEFIYALGPGAIMPDDRRFGILWIGHETLAAAFDLEDSFNDVSLTILRGTSEATVIAELDRLLEPYGTAGAYGRKDHASHWWLSNELTQLDAMGSMMSPIFLGVAAFLLHIVASRLIATEREQIGLLKAFGYSGLEVGWHYAKLVLTIVALGVVFGFAGGAAGLPQDDARADRIDGAPRAADPHDPAAPDAAAGTRRPHLARHRHGRRRHDQLDVHARCARPRDRHPVQPGAPPGRHGLVQRAEPGPHPP